MSELKFKPDKEGIKMAIEATPDIMGWWEEKVDWFYIEPELYVSDKLAVLAVYQTMMEQPDLFNETDVAIVNNLISAIKGEIE